MINKLSRLDVIHHEYDRVIHGVILSEREYKKLSRLRQVGKLLGDSFNKMQTTMIQLQELIQTKKAQKRKRDNFRMLLDYLPVIQTSLELFMYFALIDFYQPVQGVHDNTLSHTLDKSVSSLESAIRTNKWLRAFELSISILLDISDTYEYTMVPKKEAKRMYVDYTKFL
jgi:hypothetical protein